MNPQKTKKKKKRGRVLASAALPSSVAPPVVPLLAADADGDGLTDAIATTADGVFGYAQVRRPASSPEALLTGVRRVFFFFFFSRGAERCVGERAI